MEYSIIISYRKNKMTYVRPNVYPNGTPIPTSLPASYQPASLGAPAGQSCLSCKNFSFATRQCSVWLAPVKPRWWCEAWEAPEAKASAPQEVKLYKRISTTSVEEHFDTAAAQLPRSKDNYDYGVENEEDVVKLNVPLLIRLLEWAREDAGKDAELHEVAERLVELSEYGDVLDMEYYEDIIKD